MKDKTPLVGLVILLSFCSGLRLERKKEEEVVKDVRGFEEERRRGKEEERKKCCLIVPYSASQTIQVEAPLRGTLLYKKNHSAERSGKLEGGLKGKLEE